MRLPVTISNVNRFGKVTNRWHVKVGKKWRVFDQQEWVKDGTAWINSQLGGGNK